MDSITHIALGAVVGEAIAGKSLGKRAMYFGALAQSIPDIDFVASFFLSPADNLLAHRGITHSFLFGIAVTVVLAYAGRQTHKPLQIPLRTWLIFFGTEILLHLLLDACNAYGVGWLEPFSDKRFSFHILFVADPFYSIWVGISTLVLIYMDSKNRKRRFWIAFGLIGSSVYFVHALTNKLIVERDVRAALESQSIPHTRLLTTPTPINSWLWYCVAEHDNGYAIGYRSRWDDADSITFTYFPRQKELLGPFQQSHDAQQLLKFSQGFYTLEKWEGDLVIFNDLRFGQIAGWSDPKAPFVFHYYLNDSKANLLVIQRGRFSNWNRQTFNSMIQRIKGN
ncbi:MAG TPA: metal-dependent hydrolase [Chryseosolibacter sp.]